MLSSPFFLNGGFLDLAAAGFDLDRLDVHQGVRHFLVGGGYDARNGGLVNIHHLGNLRLLQILQMSQPQGFKFIQRQNDAFQLFQRFAIRPETPFARLAGHPPRLLGPHSPLLCFALVCIIWEKFFL